jgi:hypothetical protein
MYPFNCSRWRRAVLLAIFLDESGIFETAKEYVQLNAG